MDALKKSLATEAGAKGKKPRKAAAGQKEMLLPIEGKKPGPKKAAKPERSTGRRKAGKASGVFLFLEPIGLPWIRW